MFGQQRRRDLAIFRDAIRGMFSYGWKFDGHTAEHKAGYELWYCSGRESFCDWSCGVKPDKPLLDGLSQSERDAVWDELQRHLRAKELYPRLFCLKRDKSIDAIKDVLVYAQQSNQP